MRQTHCGFTISPRTHARWRVSLILLVETTPPRMTRGWRRHVRAESAHRKAAHVLDPKRLAAIASIIFVLAIGTIANAATPIGLGAADSFVVLAGAGVTNTGPTTLNGDIGTFPTTTVSGTA